MCLCSQQTLMADFGCYLYNTDPLFTITLFSVWLLPAKMDTKIERIYLPCPHMPMQSFCALLTLCICVSIIEIWLIKMSINSKPINQYIYCEKIMCCASSHVCMKCQLFSYRRGMNQGKWRWGKQWGMGSAPSIFLNGTHSPQLERLHTSAGVLMNFTERLYVALR